MAKLSVQQFAVLAGCSRQRVNELVLSKRLVRGKDKKMDTTVSENAQFLKDRAAARGAGIDGQPAPANKGLRAGVKTVFTDAQMGFSSVPEDVLAHIDADEVLSRLSAIDIRNLSPADVGKVAKLESALKTRVERQAKRGALIDRSVVRTIFGRLHTIDTNEFRTLGARLAPDIASIAGVDDPEKILQLELKIDDEVIRVLSHVKHTFGEFLHSQEEVSANV